MSDHPVTLYVMRDCPECEAARVFLREKGVVFVEVEVKDDVYRLRELMRIAGHAVVPTIVVGEDVQVGWDAVRVEEMLANPLPPEEDDLKLIFDEEEDEGGPPWDDEPAGETSSSGTRVVSAESGEGQPKGGQDYTSPSE